MTERILAIQIKRIGDLILTVPALNRIKQAFPESHLALATLGAAGELVPAMPAVDEHFNYRYRRTNLSLWARLMNDRFSIALDFNGTDRAQFMTWLSGAGIAAGYTKRGVGPFRQFVYSHTSNASMKDLHSVDHLLALLDAIGVERSTEPEPPSLALEIPGAVQRRVAEKLDSLVGGEPFAVIHPGTARQEKYWRAAHWARVTEFLRRELGWRSVITGGSAPDEIRHISRICESSVADPISVAGQFSLLESAAVIERSVLTISVDTAAMHLAAAFEKPQVVLFGPTNPHRWRPRHEKARVIFSGRAEPLEMEPFEVKLTPRPMRDIEPGHVIGAIRSLV